MCRLVEEVREACDVDITNDDVFMNAKYVFVFVYMCHFIRALVYNCVCVLMYVYVKWRIFIGRFEDFVQMVVTNSRGGGAIEFEYDAVS